VHFHADANFVTDFGLFTGHAQRVSRRGMPTSCAVLSISTSVLFYLGAVQLQGFWAEKGDSSFDA
jgi:hypothetical protein